MRELLRKYKPKELAALNEHDLQRAILNAMLERSRDRTGGMVNRHQPAAEIINDVTAMGDLQWQERKALSETLERNCRRAFDALVSANLIEPDFGMNGAQGAVILTADGKKAAANPLDHDLVRIRKRLLPDMLHEKLRGKPYEDWVNGHPTSAIQEAYKIVEIEVVAASQLAGHGGEENDRSGRNQNGPP